MKDQPINKTLEKTTQNLGNTSLVACMCQGIELTKEKKASRL